MSLREAGREVRLARVKHWALVLLVAGCAPQVTPPPKERGFYHVVQPGENLYRIGKAYGLSYRELARINGIPDPAQIRVGQKIFVPGAARQLPVEAVTPADVPAGGAAVLSGPASANGLIWPVGGKLVSGFGPRGGAFHDGIDISAPEGAPVRAAQEGEVIYSDHLRGYGNTVILRHDGGLVTVYSHNRVNLVRSGQRVSQGDIIAEVGRSGRVSGPHLHFEVRKENIAKDPLVYLPPP
jgi:lipoprotein NlpD